MWYRDLEMFNQGLGEIVQIRHRMTETERKAHGQENPNVSAFRTAKPARYGDPLSSYNQYDYMLNPGPGQVGYETQFGSAGYFGLGHGGAPRGGATPLSPGKGYSVPTDTSSLAYGGEAALPVSTTPAVPVSIGADAPLAVGSTAPGSVSALPTTAGAGGAAGAGGFGSFMKDKGIGLASNLVSNYLEKRGQDKAMAAARTASDRAEQARQESMETLSDFNIYQAAEMLFPGLLAPQTDPAAGTQVGGGSQPAAPQGAFDKRNFRAHGGPTEAGEPYMVGEQGPELMVPEQDGTVIPNDALQPEVMGPEQAGPEQLQSLVQMIVQVVMQALSQGMQGGQGMPSSPGMESPMQAEQNASLMGAEPRIFGGEVQKGEQYRVGEVGTEAYVPHTAPPSTQEPTDLTQGPTGVTPEARGEPYRPTVSDPEVDYLAQPGTRPQETTPGIRPETEPVVQGRPSLDAGGKPQDRPTNEGEPGIRPEAQPPQPAGTPTGALGYLGGAVPSGLQGEGQKYPGQLVTEHMTNFLENPGQFSSALYERDQEQANQGLNAAVQGIQGGLAQAGVDPNSPLGQAQMRDAALDATRQRSEAARDYSLAKEGLRREDIAKATADYLAFLQATFGLQQSRAAAAAGTGFPQVEPINPYTGLGTGVSTLGYGLSEYYKNRNTDQAGGDTGGTTVNIELPGDSDFTRF